MLITECKRRWEEICFDYAPRFEAYGIKLYIRYGFEDADLNESDNQTEKSTDFFATLTLVDPEGKKKKNTYRMGDIYRLDGHDSIDDGHFDGFSFDEYRKTLDSLLVRLREAADLHAEFAEVVAETEREAEARMKEIVGEVFPHGGLKLTLLALVLAAAVAIIIMAIVGMFR